MSAPAQTRSESPAQTVAGLLAALSIVGSLIALAYRPVRITPFTILIALIAAGIGGPSRRLAAAAVAIGAACFIVGTFLAIITNHPIF
jgi:predicted membrane protein